MTTGSDDAIIDVLLGNEQPKMRKQQRKIFRKVIDFVGGFAKIDKLTEQLRNKLLCKRIGAANAKFHTTANAPVVLTLALMPTSKGDV